MSLPIPSGPRPRRCSDRASERRTRPSACSRSWSSAQRIRPPRRSSTSSTYGPSAISGARSGEPHGEGLAGGEPRPVLAFAKSEFFRRGLPREPIDALVDHLGARRGSRSGARARLPPWGGAYTRLDPGGDRFPHRRERFLLKHAVNIHNDASPGGKTLPASGSRDRGARPSLGLRRHVSQLRRPGTDRPCDRVLRRESRPPGAYQAEYDADILLPAHCGPHWEEFRGALVWARASGRSRVSQRHAHERKHHQVELGRQT